MTSKDFLEKFKRLHEEKYNVILTDEEATELATHFMNLMKILIKPKSKLKINGYQESLTQETSL